MFSAIFNLVTRVELSLLLKQCKIVVWKVIVYYLTFVSASKRFVKWRQRSTKNDFQNLVFFVKRLKFLYTLKQTIWFKFKTTNICQNLLNTFPLQSLFIVCTRVVLKKLLSHHIHDVLIKFKRLSIPDYTVKRDLLNVL